MVAKTRSESSRFGQSDGGTTMHVGDMFEHDGIWYEFLGLVNPQSMRVRYSGSCEILSIPIPEILYLAIPDEFETSALPALQPERPEVIGRAGPRRERLDLVHEDDTRSGKEQAEARIKREAEDLLRTIPALRQPAIERRKGPRRERLDLLHAKVDTKGGKGQAEARIESDEQAEARIKREAEDLLRTIPALRQLAIDHYSSRLEDD